MLVFFHDSVVFQKGASMKNWKKLFFTVLVSSTAGVLADNCCNTNSTSNCCGTDTTACCAGGHIINKTVYVDTGIGQISTYLHDNFFRNDVMNEPKEGWGTALRAQVFGGKTTSGGSDGLGRRFGLNGKRCMVVAEGSDAATHTADLFRDIDPANFNLRTVNGVDNPFQSTICFCPTESLVGAVLSWKQSVCSTDEGDSRWWFELNLPIVHVEHNMRLTETIVNAGDGAIAANGLNDAPIVDNMIAAFNQPGMNYGKINDSVCMSQTELANLEFVIGYNALTGDCCKAGSYLGFAAPSTKKRCGVYVFEPIIGQDHWAFVWGTQWDIKMCEWDCGSRFMVHLGLDSHWWFKRNEIRSFDPIGKPWGRYQEMYENFAAAAAANAADSVFAGDFGINLMTRCVSVTPGFQIDGNTALAYEGCKFRAEIGHTFYAREAEKICPNWTNGPAIKSITGDGNTDTARTIGYQYQPSETLFAAGETAYTLNQIKVCDVDWNSGSHEGFLAHTIYGALGYKFNNECYPTLISVGGAYDFSTEDAGTSVMRRWNAFGQLVVSF